MEKPDQYLYKIFLSFRKIFVWSHKTFPLKGPALEIFLFLLLVLIQQFTNVWKKLKRNWVIIQVTRSNWKCHRFDTVMRFIEIVIPCFEKFPKSLSIPVAFEVSIGLRISKTLFSVVNGKYNLSGRSRLL